MTFLLYGFITFKINRNVSFFFPNILLDNFNELLRVNFLLISKLFKGDYKSKRNAFDFLTAAVAAVVVMVLELQ